MCSPSAGLGLARRTCHPLVAGGCWVISPLRRMEVRELDARHAERASLNVVRPLTTKLQRLPGYRLCAKLSHPLDTSESRFALPLRGLVRGVPEAISFSEQPVPWGGIVAVFDCSVSGRSPVHLGAPQRDWPAVPGKLHPLWARVVPAQPPAYP